MTSLQEISPRQMRALFLLLVLTPLIPTGLLLRFMFDTVTQERETAREIISSAWQETLPVALRAIEGTLKTEIHPGSERKFIAQKIVPALERTFGHEVQVQALESDGKLLSGPAKVDGQAIAVSSVGDLLPGCRIELYLTSKGFVRDAVLDQIKTYSVTASLLIAVNVAIASFAAWAFLRHLKNQELKSSSLATVAHELRTPVASMRLLLDTIREGRCSNEREYLELISQEIQRLSHLTDQFLTHSRLELGTDDFTGKTIIPSDISLAAEENLRHRLHAGNCQYHKELALDLPEVFGNRDFLVCALTNLLDNALKYTGAKKIISLHIVSRERGVEFSVRDNGVGVSPAEQKKIFTEFHQVDNRLARSGEGCGLGLSIVRRIIDVHHGRLTVESCVGAGSCFSFWIPAV